MPNAEIDNQTSEFNVENVRAAFDEAKKDHVGLAPMTKSVKSLSNAQRNMVFWGDCN